MHGQLLRGTLPQLSVRPIVRPHLIRASATASLSARISKMKLEGFNTRISECNRGAEARHTFVPFHIDEAVVGYLKPKFALELYQQYPTVFEAHVDMETTGTNVPSLLRLVGRGRGVTADLKARGVIKGWRGELYPVLESFHQPPLALLERAAAAHFGIKAYGVHINGYVGDASAGGQQLWVARRAANKPTWPGLLDHIVAGGQPHGMSPGENVVKECGEEAGIPPALASAARPVGAVSYETITADGLKRDVLFCYDLQLPADFQPVPQDGEVDAFMLKPIEEVAQLVCSTTEFKPNCNLVITDFLVRHGHLAPEQAGYLQLVASLRQGDCS